MMDLERLDAALAYEDGEFVDPPEDGTDTQSIILAAARAYRDLLANGERELCVKHDAFLIDNGDSERYCSAARRIRTCRFEKVRLLVDHPEEDR